MRCNRDARRAAGPSIRQWAVAATRQRRRSPPLSAAPEGKGKKKSLLEHDLTEREITVLRLVADGKTNKEIANVLDLSEKTVKNHVRNIFHKLHVYDRTQAAILAIRKGIIELDPHP